MSTITLPENWQLEHFVSFILLGIADADEELEVSEMTDIKAKINSITQDDERSNTVLQEVMEANQNFTTEQKIQLMTENVGKFLPTVVLRDQLKVDMEDIIVSDDSVDTVEIEIFRAVKGALRRS